MYRGRDQNFTVGEGRGQRNFMILNVCICLPRFQFFLIFSSNGQLLCEIVSQEVNLRGHIKNLFKNTATVFPGLNRAVSKTGVRGTWNC